MDEQSGGELIKLKVKADRSGMMPAARRPRLPRRHTTVRQDEKEVPDECIRASQLCAVLLEAVPAGPAEDLRGFTRSGRRASVRPFFRGLSADDHPPPGQVA